MRTNESKSLASTQTTLCPELEGSTMLANVSLHDETVSTVCSDIDDQKTSDSATLKVHEHQDDVISNESDCSGDTKSSYTLDTPCLALQEQYVKGLVSENMDMELTHSFSEENLKKNESDNETTDCSNDLEQEECEIKEEYVVTSVPLNVLGGLEDHGKSLEVASNGNTSSNVLDEEEHNNLQCLAEMYARADAKESDLSSDEASVDQSCFVEKKLEAFNNNSNRTDQQSNKIDENKIELENKNTSQQVKDINCESNFSHANTSTPKKNIPNISDQSPCYRLPKRQDLEEESEMRKQHLKRYLEELSRMPDPGEVLPEKPTIASLVELLNEKVQDQDLINQRVNLRTLIDDHEEMMVTLSKSEIKELENSLFERMKERLLSMRDDFVTSTPIENTPERHENRTSKLKLSEDELHRRFCKFTAIAKGFLTRKLLYTEKVQNLLGTVKDTANFALDFEKDSTLTKPTTAEIMLQQRVLSQLTSAMYSLHYLFIESTPEERMSTIQADRERKISEKKKQNEKKVSTATLKRRSRVENQIKKNKSQLKPLAKTLKPTLCRSPEKLDKEALNR